jgi:1-deoxyxylulose-5-phosphate synthase
MVGTMRTVELGESGLQVSEFFFGAGAIGGIGSAASTRGLGLSEDQGLAQLSLAAELGVRVVDTANSYAGGESERVVGRWLRARDSEEVLVATKVGNLVEPGQTHVDLSTAHIQRQFASSRERLGRVDLYLSHTPDTTTEPSETVEAFGQLVELGHIRAWGCCNVTAAELEALLAAAERAAVPGPRWVQNEFNLVARHDESDVLPIVRTAGLGYTPYSPLAGGLLSDRYLGDAPPEPGSRIAVAGVMYEEGQKAIESGQVARLRPLAVRNGVSIAGLALAWLRAHPDVTAPIVSPSRAGQWQAVSEALAVDLDPETLAQIDEIFPAACA